MSLFNSLYTSGLLRCSIAFLTYSSLSSTTIVEPLSALFMIRFRLWISSLNASLSFLVRLSVLFCVYLDSSKISSLILCKYVSRVPLSVSLSGFGVNFSFG